MLRFLLGLSDRQAAESVRCRIDFKYAMAMELDDLGFHHSVLADFRDCLAEDDRADRLLDLARAPPPPTAPAPWDFLHESSVTCNSVSAAEQQTPEWKTRYAVRSGVEGTVNESAHGHGMRCRYRGQGKAHIQHVLTAIAVNRAPQRIATGRGSPHTPPTACLPELPRPARVTSAEILAHPGQLTSPTPRSPTESS
ncbi:transposase [Streptomyces stelliscabiei]